MNILTIHSRRSARVFRSACLFGIAQIMLLSCSYTEVSAPPTPKGEAFAVTPPPNFTRGLIERRAPTPLYPMRASELGIEGWVMLGFSVDEDGEVVKNSVRTLQEHPEGFFENSARRAVRRLSFQNVRGEVIEDVRYVFRYQLDESVTVPLADSAADIIQFREMLPRRFITPPYPDIALELEIEGYVVVKFTVTETGAVEDVVIDESEPSGVFNDEAILAAQRLRFEPRIVAGEAVRVEDVLFRFDWNLPR